MLVAEAGSYDCAVQEVRWAVVVVGTGLDPVGSLDQAGQNSQEVEEGRGSLGLGQIDQAEEDQSRDRIVGVGSSQEIVVGEDDLEEERVTRRGSEAVLGVGLASMSSIAPD